MSKHTYYGIGGPADAYITPKDKEDLSKVLEMIHKYKVINDCFKKAEYFINFASNSLNVFEDSKEKDILKNLTYFSLERSF